MIYYFVADTSDQPDDECVINSECNLKGKFNPCADPSMQPDANQLRRDKPPHTTVNSESDVQGRFGCIGYDTLLIDQMRKVVSIVKRANSTQVQIPA